MDSVKSRVRRSIGEKRRIVELTFQSGMSVARVAQSEGINSHQVFEWRRLYRRGELSGRGMRSAELLPVMLAYADSDKLAEVPKSAIEHQAALAGSIHIELPGHVSIRVESGVDPVTLRAVLESLRK